MIFLTISGPLAFFITTEVVGVKVPDEMTAVSASFLSGSQCSFDYNANVTIGTIINGTVQDAVENSVNQYIPGRYFALLHCSELQRLFIAFSSIIFEWDCYPTFFGSDVLYLPKQKILMQSTNVDYGEWKKGISNFGCKLSEFAQRYPEKNFYIIIPDSAVTSTNNPASQYTSSFLSTKYFTELLNHECQQEDNVIISSFFVSDIDEYLDLFYKTDPHWNGQGALAYYDEFKKRIEDASGMGESVKDFEDIAIFNGQLARSGLMLFDYDVSEPDIGCSQLNESGGG